MARLFNEARVRTPGSTARAPSPRASQGDRHRDRHRRCFVDEGSGIGCTRRSHRHRGQGFNSLRDECERESRRRDAHPFHHCHEERQARRRARAW